MVCNIEGTLEQNTNMKNGKDFLFQNTQLLRRKEMLTPESDDRFHEKWAVLCIFLPDKQVASYVYHGLFSLQHRGQEGSGITTSDGENLYEHKAQGLVTQVFTKYAIESLTGHIAIGHNRYATSGGTEKHSQPVISEKKIIALAHNGTLPQVSELQNFLNDKKVDIQDLNDSELIQRGIEYYVEQGMSLPSAVKQIYSKLTGAFALTIMDRNTLVGVRDSYGIRPLSLGRIGNNGYAISSETCGLDSIGAIFDRDVKPGEMVVINKDGLHAEQIVQGQEKLDIFEMVYFASPGSRIYGKVIDDVRRSMGVQLAREKHIDADIVIPVPNSAVSASIGYAKESGIPHEQLGFLKSAYAHRTFITPGNGLRLKAVEMKYKPMKNNIEGKRVVVIDDSIVRGTTSKALVKMLRDAGAAEVHFLSASPPVQFPDFYGIDTPDQKDLIASYMTEEQIRDYIGADSIQYLSLPGLFTAIGISEEKFCTSCFTGNYPIPIGRENEENVNFVV